MDYVTFRADEHTMPVLALVSWNSLVILPVVDGSQSFLNPWMYHACKMLD